MSSGHGSRTVTAVVDWFARIGMASQTRNARWCREATNVTNSFPARLRRTALAAVAAIVVPGVSGAANFRGVGPTIRSRTWQRN